MIDGLPVTYPVAIPDITTRKRTKRAASAIVAGPPRHFQRILIKKSLLPLALGGFGIGMTEFVIMGILPDIAGSLQITIPQAGYLITAYALGVVVGAPTLVSLMAHRPPRSVLIWFMAMFTLFNAMSAFAPNFEVMMLSRFMAGLPHGAFFGVGAVVASQIGRAHV